MSYPIDSKTWRSPNFASRNGTPIGSLVIHSCEGALPSPRRTSLPWLCNPNSKVSCHYYVCRDTTIYQLVDDANEAWHAGIAQSAFTNPHSIGVECEHRSGQDWPDAQKDALTWLCKQLIATYHIPIALVETHGQIAIKGPYSRKHDPTNWSHDAFVLWRLGLYAPTPRGYRVAGLPVYQRSDRTGPLWGILPTNEQIVIDDPTNGHLQDGRGFVDMQGLV